MTVSRKVRLVSPYPYTHHTTVRSDSHGKELYTYLAERFPYVGEKLWRHRENEGLIHILRNGKSIKATNFAGACLVTGDTIVHHVPNMIEPSVPDEVMILEEDSDILVLFKPAPMPMHATTTRRPMWTTALVCFPRCTALLQEPGAAPTRGPRTSMTRPTTTTARVRLIFPANAWAI